MIMSKLDSLSYCQNVGVTSSITIKVRSENFVYKSWLLYIVFKPAFCNKYKHIEVLSILGYKHNSS